MKSIKILNDQVIFWQLITVKIYQGKSFSLNFRHPFNYRWCLKFRLGNLLSRSLFTWRWGPQIGEVTWGGSPHVSCKRDQLKMRDYMDRRVTPPKRITLPTWGSPPPCKQALRLFFLWYLPARTANVNWTVFVII